MALRMGEGQKDINTPCLLVETAQYSLFHSLSSHVDMYQYALVASKTDRAAKWAPDRIL
jgi:hypothetical protein